MQEEKPTDGTLHLQGCFHAKKKMRMTALKKLLTRAHFEVMRGTWEQADTYCQKETFPNAKFLRVGCTIPISVPSTVYAWQRDLILLLDTPPNDRTIHWYFDSAGGTGKTALCRLLVVKRGALMVGGTAKDVQYTIAARVKDGKEYPSIVLWNLTRSQLDHLSYAGMESVKDAIFCSPKYESAMVVGNHPHLIVFANVEPDYEKLSSDRWSVVNLEGTNLTETYPIPPRPPLNTTLMNFDWEDVEGEDEAKMPEKRSRSCSPTVPYDFNEADTIVFSDGELDRVLTELVEETEWNEL